MVNSLSPMRGDGFVVRYVKSDADCKRAVTDWRGLSSVAIRQRTLALRSSHVGLTVAFSICRFPDPLLLLPNLLAQNACDR
jgi:hypothetical protein